MGSSWPSPAMMSHMDSLVSDTAQAPLLLVKVDPGIHLAEGELILRDVDVDQFYWRLALVAVHGRFGLQVTQPTQSQPV
jgi:hypothetical protein